MKLLRFERGFPTPRARFRSAEWDSQTYRCVCFSDKEITYKAIWDIKVCRFIVDVESQMGEITEGDVKKVLINVTVLLPTSVGCQHPYVELEKNLIRANVQDLCGLDVGFHLKRVHQMVFGSRPVAPEPPSRIRTMFRTNLYRFFGKSEQRRSVDQVLREREVDINQVAFDVVPPIIDLRVFCQVWGIEPVKVDKRSVFDGTKKTLGKIYGLVVAMYIWSRANGGPMVDPWLGR